MNFRKYIGNIFMIPLFDDQKNVMAPAAMLKKHFAFWRQKFVATQSSLDYFCDPIFFNDNFVTPSFFMTPSLQWRIMIAVIYM